MTCGSSASGFPSTCHEAVKEREGKGDEAETGSGENKRAQDVMLSCC